MFASPSAVRSKSPCASVVVFQDYFIRGKYFLLGTKFPCPVKDPQRHGLGLKCGNHLGARRNA